MKAVTILYHDVVATDWDESGFPGAAAARYKLQRDAFSRHLDALVATGIGKAVAVSTALAMPSQQPFLFSVDDGGVSALHIADELERRGWIGHFFITTDRIGTPAFLTAADIRGLHERGHVIGSHSRSHPSWMSEMASERLAEEWGDSIAVLSRIVGEAITVASVPGGFYAPRVAEAAHRAGISVLFNSEPTVAVSHVMGCAVLGRFTVYRGMSEHQAARLVAGRHGARALQAALWTAKKLAKTYARPLWQKARHVTFGAPR